MADIPLHPLQTVLEALESAHIGIHSLSGFGTTGKAEVALVKIDAAISQVRLLMEESGESLLRECFDFFNDAKVGIGPTAADERATVLMNKLAAHFYPAAPNRTVPAAAQLDAQCAIGAERAPAGVVVSAYTIDGDPRRAGTDDIRIERAKQMEGPPLWAIRCSGNCLSRTGEWEYEPMPSSRDDEFLARCRFPNATEAIVAALRARVEKAKER